MKMCGQTINLRKETRVQGSAGPKQTEVVVLCGHLALFPTLLEGMKEGKRKARKPSTSPTNDDLKFRLFLIFLLFQGIFFSWEPIEESELWFSWL